MTRGKKARQRRQASPPVRSTAGRRASPKVLAIGLGVVVAAAAAAALAFALRSGGSSTPAETSATTLPDAGSVTQLFRGLPQHGTVLGRANAAVTLVEYIDLQCPFCRTFETDVLPEVVRGYVRTGKLRIEARPVAILGPDSERGRDAALAAGAQNRFFEFCQLLYVNQGPENTGWLSDSLIESAYVSIPGLDPKAADAVRSSTSVKAQGVRFDRQARSDKVRGTPTVLVGKTGDRLTVVSNDITSVTEAIARALKSS